MNKNRIKSVVCWFDRNFGLYLVQCNPLSIVFHQAEITTTKKLCEL